MLKRICNYSGCNEMAEPGHTYCKKHLAESQKKHQEWMQNNKKKNEENAMMTSASEILGYWPKREEFDIEYLNDAELELSELEFHDDDTKEERNAKMKILQIPAEQKLQI